MENNTELSSADVLKYNPRWTDVDRAVIEGEIVNTGSTSFALQQNVYTEHIAATALNGQSTMHISKGR